MRLGDTEEAKSRAAALGMTSAHQERPPWAAKGHGRDIYLSTLADLKLSEPHNIDDTESLIETLFEQAKKEGRTARMVDMRLMQSLLHLRNANMSKAVRRMTQAVNLATTDHIIRPFFDRTAELAPLIEDTRPSTWGFPREAERAFFAAICERVPISDPRLKERLVSGNLASEPREALTKRQMELLLLIEAGLSNQQIADRLDLSLSTVKGHIQGLFGKLDVPSRSSAIAKARILDLI